MPPLTAVSAIALSSALLAAPQQSKSAWQLPDGAFVEYERKRTKAQGFGMLKKGPDPAPGFYEWEIGSKGAIEYRSSTLVDLIPQLGCTLSRRTPSRGSRVKVTRLFERVQSFGAVRASGTIATSDVSDASKIVQTGTFKLERRVPDYPRKVRRFYPGHLLTGNSELVDAKLTFVRHFDAVRGRVSFLEAQLRGKMAGQQKNAKQRPFEIDERWTLVDVREPRYRGFQTRVDKAIDRGVKHLEGKLDEWFKKGNLTGKETNKRSYGTGRLALILLTLVKGEPDRQKKSVQRLLGLMRERNPVDSYSLAVCLMALEAYYGPPNEAEQIREGLIDEPQQRKLSPPDLALMQKWTRRLLENFDTRVDRGYEWRFNYVKGRRFDNSVTQYAVLGLRSAALCGVEIEPSVWIGLASHFVRQQGKPEGKARPLRLPTHGEIARLAQAKKRRGGSTVARSKRRLVEPTGYGYTSPNHPTGSMTCAGMAGAGICLSMLRGPEFRSTQDVQGKLAECLRGAFSWMAVNYDVRDNPRRDRSHFYYYLYGLERACEINGVARIHQRDWYFDGAMQLLNTHHKNGGWGRLQETCFAVLFLKRAVAPVITTR